MAYEPFSKPQAILQKTNCQESLGEGLFAFATDVEGRVVQDRGCGLGKTCMTPFGHLYVNSRVHWARRCALQSGSHESTKCIVFQRNTIVSWLKKGGRHSNVLSFEMGDVGTQRASFEH